MLEICKAIIYFKILNLSCLKREGRKLHYEITKYKRIIKHAINME